MHATTTILLCWVLIVSACITPGSFESAAPTVLVALVALVGLPHGAADDRFARFALEPRLRQFWLPVFLTGYLLVAAAVVAGWFLAPAATIVVFLIASAWHFGNEEPALGPGAKRLLFRVARGGLVIWVPVVFRSSEVQRVLSVTTPTEAADHVQSALAMLTPIAPVMLAIATAGWLFQLESGFHSHSRKRLVLLRDCVLVASLAALFAIVNVLGAFVIYFCAWHSIRGLRRLKRVEKGSWVTLYRSLAPLTLLAVLLVAAGSWIVWRSPTLSDAMIRSTFIGLSALATPHLLLHGALPLWRNSNRDPASGSLVAGRAF